jgi:hypothetical protein
MPTMIPGCGCTTSRTWVSPAHSIVASAWHEGSTSPAWTAMDGHPDVVLLGTAWRHIDLIRGFERDFVFPTEDTDLRRAMVVENPFGHPSVMIRANALRAVNSYDESFRYVQDYELWSRLALVGQIANLPEVLVLRRYHLGNVTSNLRAQLTRVVLNMKAQYLAIRRLGFPWRYLVYVLRPLLLLPLELYCMSRARHRPDRRREGEFSPHA